MWNGRTVLITGGAGFIGSWLAHTLARNGARAVVLDIKEGLSDLEGAFSNDVRDRIVYISGDVRDKNLLQKLFAEYDFGTVFHLAAEALVGEALQKPETTLDVNIRGTYTLIETFRMHRTAHAKREVIVASSDKAYGTVATLPYTEKTELRGQDHPYDLSKHCADRIALMYAAVYNVPVCVTRFGNVFGGGDYNYSRLVPDAIRSLCLNKPFHMRSDGTMRRDYVYVEDVVSAYLALAEAMHVRNLAGHSYNFGNNEPHAVRGVVKRIVHLFGSNIEVVSTGEAKREIHDQYLDSTKARHELGWAPAFSFDEGLAKTIDWYKRHFAQAK